MATVRDTTFKEIYVKSDMTWARFFWEKKTGLVIIVSDYGNWSYCWTHIGRVSLPLFLSQLDSQYMGKKMLSTGYWVFDHEATVKEIKSTILRLRRDTDLEKDEAAAEWDAVKKLESGFFDTNDWYNASNLDLFCDSDEYRRTQPNSDWQSFWDRIWVPHIKPELVKLCTITIELGFDPKDNIELRELFKSEFGKAFYLLWRRDHLVGEDFATLCLAYTVKVQESGANTPDAVVALFPSNHDYFQINDVRKFVHEMWPYLSGYNRVDYKLK